MRPESVGSRDPKWAPLGQDPLADSILDSNEDDVDALVDQILGSKPRPIDWTRVTGKAADEQWAALDSWVRWLVARYGIDPREIPPCWDDHGDFVEELTALYTAHRAALDPAGPPTGPADWHAVLAHTRLRLRESVARTGCRGSTHRPASTPAWAAGGSQTVTPDVRPREP